MGRKPKKSGHKYKVFSRAWYYPDGSPHPGASKRHIAWAESEEQARALCLDWNNQHNPGPCGVMAEFEGC